jgi:type I restriction enzyme S subunit
MARPGNILIAMTGATVGKFGIVPITDEPLYVNQRVGFFNLGTEPLDKLPFLINSLNQKYFREAIFTLASGAAQPNISNEQINSIQLLFAEKSLIEEYNLKFKAYYSKILLNQYQNQKLAKLRDWLLPMLMNGQVVSTALNNRGKEYEMKESEVNVAAEPKVKYGK